MKIKIFSLLFVLFSCFEALGQTPYLISDINAAIAGTNIVSFENMGSLNGKLYFLGEDGISGAELWRTDGTAAGTMLLKDINAGSASSAVDKFFAINGLVYFTATNGTHGVELWRTDGTALGTFMVKDIFVGSGNSSPIQFTNVNGTLFFSADNGNLNNGRELWKSDGTETGTVMVKDIRFGGIGSYPYELLNINGILFFSAEAADRELWKSDGTAAGTVRVKNINLTPCCDLHSSPRDFVNVNGTLYFSADDGTHGRELWRSNGTAVGTVLVADIYPGGIGSDPTNLTWVAETATLYYAADNGIHGIELHSFNQLGIGLEADINPTGSSLPDNLLNVNGVLYFTADDGMHGTEPWQSDLNLINTSGTTSMLADIYVGLPSSSPRFFTKINSDIYFSANDGSHGNELWKTDGTGSGTTLVKDIAKGITSSYPSRLASVNNGGTTRLFFTANVLPFPNYYTQYWSFGNCSSLNSMSRSSKKVFNQVIQTNPTSLSCHCDILNNLIASVNATGSSPLEGSVDSEVWIEATQSSTFVKRHYEVNPVINANSATGTITLYFLQSEFDEFNALNTVKLPTNSSDFVNFTNIRVEKREGRSSNGFGLPISYSGTVTTINPLITGSVVWRQNRWEVTFDVVGFGGFFLKTSLAPVPVRYSFIGDGNWSVASNWAGGFIPPLTLTAPNDILIDPVSNGECVLTSSYLQTIATGARIRIAAGKKIRLEGDLIIQ